MGTEDYSELAKQTVVDAEGKPVLLEPLNTEELDKLRELAQDHLDNIADRGDSDDVHYIYEQVMILFYGTEVWDYVNKKLK